MTNRQPTQGTRPTDTDGTGHFLEPVSYDAPAERGLLGALLMHGPQALPALDGFDPSDCSPDYGTIIGAAIDVAQADLRPDDILMFDRLGRTFVDRYGAQDLRVLFIQAMHDAPSLSSVAKYADVVTELARTRRIQAAALDLARHPDANHAPELLDRLATLRTDTGSRRLTLTKAAAVDAARPHWVWDQRIPVGGVTLMAGREGHGKTLLVCWLAARLTRGQLPGEFRGIASDVVYVGLEDDRSTIIKPRLIAAGADVDRFHFVDLHHETFALDTHLDDLTAALANLNVGLIVIDPLDAHLGGVDSHKKGEVQAAIGKLSDLVQDLRCGALGLAHFNKNTGLNDLLTRVSGSSGFSTAVRSVLAIGPHPENENDRLCLLAKANNTSKTDVKAVRYRIESQTVDDPANPDEPIPTAGVAIIGEEDGHQPDQLLAPADPEQRTMIADALDWLYNVLAGGPQPRVDVERLAREHGITNKTLRTARDRLRVVAERNPNVQGRPSTWSLPPDAEPP
ncbi:MAG: AAA family ATPase [Actinomycetota bacterium]